MEKHANTIEYEVYGDYALFSDPVVRVGGEKTSYSIPTYEALRGITESIFWKPTISWVIDEIRVMNRIQTETKGIRPIKYNGGNELAYYTYLKDVRYQVHAHFEFNEHQVNMVQDRNERKYQCMSERMVKSGGRRDIFLGTRECQGYVEPCTVMEGEGFYDNDGNISFGIMVHGITYSDEAVRENEKKHMTIRLWNAYMKDGVIRFPEPEECQIRKAVAEMEMKTFDETNFCGVKEFERGNLFGLDTNA